MMTVAQTILEQLGGHHFRVMTGAKDFVDVGSGLRMTIGRNSTRCNRVTIRLMDNDTYEVEFGRYSPKNFDFTVMEIKTDVYADNLRDVFENYTGLRTSLKG